MIESSALLIPILTTGLAPFFIWLLRTNINAREGVSFAAGILTFGSVLTFVPPVLRGEVLVYPLFVILPGIEVKFCADGLALIFALVASFLWILATAYNIGYMRSLKEHAQTRYYFCFAVAIFGAVGVAMAANVFTLYLFYEVITVFTYPLVAHHQDAEAYHGARKYLVYLMGTSKLFLLPAMILTYVLCGTLDFRLGDISQRHVPARRQPGAGADHLRSLRGGAGQGGHHAAAQLAALGHGGAHPGLGPAARRGRGEGRRVLGLPGPALRLRGQPHGRPGPGGGHDRVCRLHHRRGLGHRPDQGRPQGAAGLLHGEPAFLRGAGGVDADPARRHRRGGPHRAPRLQQDHALFHGRGHLRGHPPEEDQHDVRAWAAACRGPSGRLPWPRCP